MAKHKKIEIKHSLNFDLQIMILNILLLYYLKIDKPLIIN